MELQRIATESAAAHPPLFVMRKEHGAVATSAMPAHQSPHSHHSSLLSKFLLGAGVVTMGIIAMPYLLQLGVAAGVVDEGLYRTAEAGITALCGGEGTGLAASFSDLLSQVPLFGPDLAKGGMTNAIASVIVGLGGTLLGHYVEKKTDGSHGIRWGSVIKTAALATSILVGMPAIITGISMGLLMIGKMGGIDVLAKAATWLGSTGTMSGVPTGMTSIASTLGAHLVSCGAPIISTTLSAWGYKKAQDARSQTGHSPAHAHDVPPGESTHRIKILSVEPPLQKGMESTVEFCLTDLKTNRILHEPEMEVMHGMPIHAFVTEPSLSEYHHVHPQAVDGKNGVFAYKITPQGEQGYKMFADIHPKGSHYQALQTPLPGKGKALSAEMTRQEHHSMHAESAFAR